MFEPPPLPHEPTIVEIVNTVNIDNSSIDLPVAIMDCDPNQEVTINRYEIGNVYDESSVSFLSNEERLSFFDNV